MSVQYYSDAELFRVRDLITNEVREGVHSLRASYLSAKYHMEFPLVQRVLSDLASEGVLEPRYLVLCSGPNQRFDPDKEYTDLREIPHHPITCGTCGDIYTPSEENILVSFEPTESYLESISQRR
jgi:hypothetical protein